MAERQPIDDLQAHADPNAKAASMKAARFFGEPVALGYLAFTEAWERFSYFSKSVFTTNIPNTRGRSDRVCLCEGGR